MQDVTALCAAPVPMTQSDLLQSAFVHSVSVQTSASFLHIAPDVRLHIQTLDMLCAAAGSRIYVFDRAARYLYASQAGAAILGLTPAQMIGSTIYDLDFPPESNRKLASDLGLVFATGQAFEGENWIQTEHGARHYAYTLHPLAGADGIVNAVAVTVMDITARKRAEQELERKQAQTESLNLRLRRAMTETHHRVKNNLQLIAAMIDMRVMQSPLSVEGQADSADTLVCSINDMRRLSACVRTLAIVHDILTQETKNDAHSLHVSMRAAQSPAAPDAGVFRDPAHRFASGRRAPARAAQHIPSPDRQRTYQQRPEIRGRRY